MTDAISLHFENQQSVIRAGKLDPIQAKDYHSHSAYRTAPKCIISAFDLYRNLQSPCSQL